MPSTPVKEGLESFDADVPAVFQKLIEMASAGDAKTAIHLMDGRPGNPTVAIENEGRLDAEVKALLEKEKAAVAVQVS